MRRRLMQRAETIIDDGGYPIGVDLIALGIAVDATGNGKGFNVSGVRPGEVYEIYTEANTPYKYAANVRDSNGNKLVQVVPEKGVPIRMTIPEGGTEIRAYLIEYPEENPTVYIKRVS